MRNVYQAKGLEEERRLMYVACTRAQDRLYFTESEGYNVQNSQGKYPSRFIREACDLYDTVGKFDYSLWTGTDALIAKLEGEINRKDQPKMEKGTRISHQFFGNGEIIATDDDGIATVRFENFGKRKIAISSLEQLLSV